MCLCCAVDVTRIRSLPGFPPPGSLLGSPLSFPRWVPPLGWPTLFPFWVPAPWVPLMCTHLESPPWVLPPRCPSRFSPLEYSRKGEPQGPSLGSPHPWFPSGYPTKFHSWIPPGIPHLGSPREFRPSVPPYESPFWLPPLYFPPWVPSPGFRPRGSPC